MDIRSPLRQRFLTELFGLRLRSRTVLKLVVMHRLDVVHVQPGPQAVLTIGIRDIKCMRVSVCVCVCACVCTCARVCACACVRSDQLS